MNIFNQAWIGIILMISTLVWFGSATIVLFSLIKNYSEDWKSWEQKRYPFPFHEGSRVIVYLWKSAAFFKNRNSTLYIVSLIGNVAFLLLVPIILYSFYLVITL